MGNEKKIEVLRGAAQRKRQESLAKTSEAIEQLVKQGKRITFPSVAESAGVSVTYLYKYPEIRERIEHLRNQQELTAKKTASPQPASDTSKAVIIYNLKQEINKLRAENRGLRDQIEMVYGRVHSLRAAEQEATILKAEIATLQTEINSLKEQLDKCHKPTQVQSTLASIESVKITSLDKKRAKQSDVSDKIKSKLAEVGVDLNSTLSKTIKSVREEIVLGAIEALKEAMINGGIERPGGWLNRAIKDGWIPNEKHLPQDQVERDIFKEWFDLAYKQRLVLASTKGDDEQLYVYNLNGMQLPFNQMLAEYPLEQLRASL